MSLDVSPTSTTVVNLTAPLLLGSLCNAFLFGILSVQLYIYFITFPDDKIYLKFLVYGVFVIDTLSTLMLTSDTYHWFSAGFGSMSALDNPYLSPIDTPVLGAIVATAVQTFYCYRIAMIERRAWPISAAVMLIVIAQLGGAVWVGIADYRLGSLKKVSQTAIPGIWLLFGGAGIADTVIAATMCVLLCKRHSATETNRTRETVRKIVLLIAETNLTSTIVALSTLVLFLVLKGVYFTFPSIILGKVYSNSLFLILNNRIYLTDDVPGGIKIKNGPEKLQKDPYVNGNFGMTILRTKESSGEGANVEWMAGVRVDVHTARHLDEP